ncbi:DEAD/DEAH box helicase [Marinobacter zhanjiangensis]|uniref:ATP-dependent RNA helicase RhlE n=1 Tax=Marinobacter zhanjiangensis TaxID=578215 RepID=A0ABQ3AN65_9GAMM|nr:DEAD/DEAH box helicase [Marinobacter zhanjiangensis]GGY62533.1 ATP-dependent RNA helicase RhlE [Marinobacter zhanjiangensis]
MSFSSLGLSEALVRATNDQGYDTPSPIQAQAIPAVLSGRDVMAAAQTGTGKTAGFTLPLLQRLGENPREGKGPRALILTPTRELAAQVHDSVNLYSKYVPTKAAVVFGGVKINPQMMKLRKGLDVLVATPGRLLDLYQQGAVKFNEIEILVLDEADRMLDMGFIRDIRKILALLPAKRQNLLFSATFSNEIRKLTQGLLDNPVLVEVATRNKTAEGVDQTVYPVDQSQKTALLSKLVRDNDWEQVLVFTRTKHGANRLTKKLEGDGITAAAIHGNKSQGARTRALAEFKQGDIRVLVATDIAARGLDIKQLPQVVNFELPQVAEDYVHRIGRTGRAGESGHAMSLVSADEGKMLADIEKLIKKQLPRKEVEGFEPSNNLPLKPKAKADPSRARGRNAGNGGGGGNARNGGGRSDGRSQASPGAGGRGRGRGQGRSGQRQSA